MKLISDAELRVDSVPSDDAPLEELARFAHSFDGYAHWGGHAKCAEVANARDHSSLTHLRTCLFFEARRWRHFGEAPDAEAETYWRLLASKIRQVVGARPLSEKQLDLALAGALQNSPAFLGWFISNTRFAGEEVDKVVLLRANSPWGASSLRVWSEEEQAYVPMKREGETDVLLVLQSRRRGRFALHIENKRATGSFTPYQADLYRARAMAWRGNETYGDYEEWETVIVAPEAFLKRHPYDASKFDRQISYEALAAHVPEFRLNESTSNS
jgi:hypothetical protein